MGKRTGVRGQKWGNVICKASKYGRGGIDRPRQTGSYHHFTGLVIFLFRRGEEESYSGEKREKRDLLNDTIAYPARLDNTKSIGVRVCVCILKRGPGI